MLASSAVDSGFESRSYQTKDYELLLLHSIKEEKTDSGWLGMKIVYPSGSTCLPVDFYVCEQHNKH